MVGVVAAAAVALVTAFPAVAATSCPGCYGMTEVAPDLYVSPEPSPAQRESLIELVGAARQRVGDFYGGRRSSPTIVACLDDECYDRIGGGRERGVAVLDRAVMLSPRGIDVTIASHEMSHVELHQRLGGVRDQVPQWFDEGLAVVLSDDRRYIAPTGTPDRCLVRPDGPLPVTLEQWLGAAGADAGTYAEAACQVSRWLSGHDSSRSATGELVEGLTAGRPFHDLVR